MSRFAAIINDLRRRRVFRVAGLYIVAAWVLLQVFDLAFESWGIDESAMRYVWIAALVLFPIALVFGWRYDFTGDGLVRTEAGDASDDLGLRPFDIGLMASVLLIAGISAWFLVARIDATPGTLGQPTTNPEPAVAAEPPALTAIAVLPFATRSSDEGTAFFADGIHDDLLTRLAQVAALKVISRTSVLAYRDSPKNLRDIGGELGAGSILEGGVQQAGDNVRINVQLIDAATDEHLWARSYDRELSMANLFDIQTEIVETIAAELETTLSAGERQRIRSGTTDDVDAFREYLRGKQQMELSSFDGLRNAIDHFEAAAAIDPGYSLPLTGIANSYARLAATGAISVDEMLARGTPFLERSLALDSSSGYAQAVRARYAAQRGDDEAEAMFIDALALAPNDVDAMTLYANYLRERRRSEESLVIIRQALELDPLSVTLYHELGRTQLGLGRFEQAERAFNRIGEINPGNPYAAHGNALATILGGQLVRAGAYSDEAARMDPADYENPATAVFIYGSVDNWPAAQRRMEEALLLGPDEPFPLAAQAYYLARNGERDRALGIARAALAKGLDDRWGSDWVFLRLVRDDALATGNHDEALAWYRERLPVLFDGEPAVDATNIGKAVDLARLLQAAGDTTQAERVLLAVIDVYDREYKRGAANYPLGITKVDALALLGRDDAALAELQKLVDDGWRMRWRWDTLMNPNLASLHDDPRFRRITDAIAADIERQKREFSDRAY